MHNPNTFTIRTNNTILLPTPHVSTSLIQRHPTQRRPHLQPLEPAQLGLALAIPHHHRAQPFPRPVRMREDGADRRPLARWVPCFGHASRRSVSTVERPSEGPATACTDGCGGVDRVEDEVGAILGNPL